MIDSADNKMTPEIATIDSADANGNNVTKKEKKLVIDANQNEVVVATKEGTPKSEEGSEADPEAVEWSNLRCNAEQTEEIAQRERAKKEREERRKSRCADYPGLAFGSAMFGSDTTMKFNIIKNELHNIMRSQLRRVEGEVTALSNRIKSLDENLALSEKYIKTATQALSEAVQLEVESRKDRGEEEEEENALSHFDAQLKLLEGKLMQARLLAAMASEEEGGARDGGGGQSEVEFVPSSRLLARASSPAASLQGKTQQSYKPLRAPKAKQ